MELIETIEVGSGGASSIEFTNIPQDGTDLVVKLSTRSNNTENLSIFRVNGGDSGLGKYTGIELTGNGSSASSTSRANLFYLYHSDSGDTANTFSSIDIYISNYASTTQNKSISVDDVSENNGTAATQMILAGSYNENTAITGVEFPHANDVWVEGTTASLYKITAEDNYPYTPSPVALATGGTITYENGYYYHTFTSSGTFTPSEDLTCDYLVVAGGGGSGTSQNFGSGGGGAGGYLAFSSQSLTTTGYSVIVGSGGSSSSNGSNSSFNGATAIGGGAGGDSASQNGSSGGSGGGAGGSSAGEGSGTAGQGNDGGFTDGSGGGGGGGGAAEAGADSKPFDYLPGDGGDGSQWVNGTYYAGGGGGGGSEGGVTSTGGIGGGGDGIDNTTGDPGQANTGGGAGGGSNYQSGSAGGSGIVIVRYAA